jgi:hypothetical protein
MPMGGPTALPRPRSDRPLHLRAGRRPEAAHPAAVRTDLSTGTVEHVISPCDSRRRDAFEMDMPAPAPATV